MFADDAHAFVRRLSPSWQQLIGSAISVRPRGQDPTEGPFVMALYNAPYGVARRAIIWSLSLANDLGSALAMIPPPESRAVSNQGQFPELQRQGLQTIADASCTLFAGDSGAPLTLAPILGPREPIEPILAARLRHATSQLSLSVTFERYQGGWLRVLGI